MVSLTEASAALRSSSNAHVILIWHLVNEIVQVVVALIVDVIIRCIAMGRLRSLGEQMSATSNVSLWPRWATHVVGVLTNIQNSLWLVLNHAVGHLLDQFLVFVTDWWDVARRVLRADAIVLAFWCVILGLELWFILISHHNLIRLILLLRKLVILSSVGSKLFRTRSTSNWSTNRVAFLITRSLGVVTLLFDDKLVCRLSSSLFLHNLVALSLELLVVVETAKLLFRLVWG